MALRPRPAASSWGRALELSLEFFLAVVVGLALGYYLDRWLGTEPVFLFLFLALGFAAGIRGMLRVQAADLERARRERDSEPRDPHSASEGPERDASDRNRDA